MAISTDIKKINELLSRGIEEVIDKSQLEKKLKSGKQLRIKLGIDPTSPNIHIGRAVPLFKLRDFQELGHKIVLIIGDFTGVIGDTSDKDSERPMLTEKEVKQNLKSYIQQAEKVINIKKCEVHYNSEWLGKLDYHEIGRQANVFSLNEFISRENIKKRLDAGKHISLRELLYPLMQGYDSVAIKADVEIGGTDQRFNLLAGWELQRYYGQEPQDIITNPLIEGLDGRKMSSSWGNTINLFDSANEMFGKVMSLKDELIIKYFTLTTRVSIAEIEKYQKELTSGNPRDYKIKLAFEIVRFYHSESDAKKAQEYFIKTFSKKETPETMPEIKPSNYDIITAIVESGLSPTKSEARRVIEQKGVKLNEAVVDDIKQKIQKGDVIQKGKRFFIRIS
ncbi:MAG: tyrosine--tRNA ligase [Parcubacteria group bacterium CG1_02_37_51]|uniref:Tyrosine--tRNA ligase n=2 Tax=Candidatus Komeiliibacteriota TaxID=1817908 RepID=A0A2M8DRV8_9BACT|nr:MAG: tyrosine--tRNA ligase [Parcubacteria group bacterium CG1_02_37_51]PIY94712.1 MAG: tyrosine--tRNA ligase [Candidatus Komeilibacteria bacterium CG_4_10_14_0_8_um_filter_37_78]PJC02112.1 MAG: tyrosine--tRNA ligase [Candidatus Komeilibacteria bacterium CG_4_9_14_0_8_um_filter_36_9]